MGGGPDFVNIVTGRDISWLVTLSNFAGTINVSGGQPFVISGDQIATLDPTLFATFDRALMDFSRGVSSAIPMFEGFSNMPGGTAIAFAAPQSPAARVEDVFASIPGLSAYAADPMAFKKPEVVLADGAALWARGFGGERIQPSDGILFKATSEYYGGMMGGDWLVRPELRLGAFIGGGATRTSLDQNAGWANSDLVFGGGFARYAFGESFLQAVVQGGPSQNSTSRTIASNLAPNLQTATASYDGWYISPEMTYGLRHALGSYNGVTWTMTPNLRVRYLYGAFDGYTETGSNANLTVAGRAVRDLEERGEVKLIAQTLWRVADAGERLWRRAWRPASLRLHCELTFARPANAVCHAARTMSGADLEAVVLKFTPDRWACSLARNGSSCPTPAPSSVAKVACA